MSGQAAQLSPLAGARVAVAMSGGVDSSVAAALLARQGYQVVGVHMKLVEPDPNSAKAKSCCSLDDALDARQVCARLDVPFYVLDMRQPFKEQVVDYFLSSYRHGQTPNPCVMCNQRIKNQALWRAVSGMGCQYLATGHYARVGVCPKTGRLQLQKPRDEAKDQTYFLWGTPADALGHLLFPLEGLDKSAARKLAAELGLANWNKPDSQEICFVPGDYRDFLASHPEGQGGGQSGQGGALSGQGGALTSQGEMVDVEGRVVGRHQGLAYYTVGQRKGLGLTSAEPLYVVRLEPATNRLVVGPQEALYADTFYLSGLNWVSIDPPSGPLRCQIKVRYAHTAQPGLVEPLVGAGRAGGWARVRLDGPVRAITPGQAAAFYQDNVLLGGGWIEPGPPQAGEAA